MQKPAHGDAVGPAEVGHAEDPEALAGVVFDFEVIACVPVAAPPFAADPLGADDVVETVHVMPPGKLPGPAGAFVGGFAKNGNLDGRGEARQGARRGIGAKGGRRFVAAHLPPGAFGQVGFDRLRADDRVFAQPGVQALQQQIVTDWHTSFAKAEDWMFSAANDWKWRYGGIHAPTATPQVFVLPDFIVGYDLQGIYDLRHGRLAS